MAAPYETYFYGRHGSALTYNGFVLGNEWWPNIQLPPFTLRILFNEFCRGCTSLSYIPDFSIASLYGGNFTDMFRNCNNVAYGSYNMYVKLNNHMGGQLPPSSLNKVFSNCGIDSPTGLVELNKIPVTYGGLKPIA